MSDSPVDRIYPATLVEVGSRSEEIDKVIAPLIREMWIADIDTIMSCQDDGSDRIWVEFEDVDDLVEFLNAIAEFEPGRDTLYNRMKPYFRTTDPELDWIYELHPNDMAFTDDGPSDADVVQPRHEGTPYFFFTVSVRFPPSDLPVVLSRMQRFNAVNRRN
jgi:hypothetical protein